MTKEELQNKVNQIAADLKAKFGEVYEVKFRKHCERSKNLSLTLKKERTKEEWKTFLDKKDEEKNK